MCASFSLSCCNTSQLANPLILVNGTDKILNTHEIRILDDSSKKFKQAIEKVGHPLTNQNLKHKQKLIEYSEYKAQKEIDYLATSRNTEASNYHSFNSQDEFTTYFLHGPPATEISRHSCRAVTPVAERSERGPAPGDQRTSTPAVQTPDTANSNKSATLHSQASIYPNPCPVFGSTAFLDFHVNTRLDARVTRWRKRMAETQSVLL
ncbi:hypothetical protein BGX38DRAFT_1256002 [Terfezia claveryi]|nr:hypothetical protein BGX38DRAFT_1256002 [Terfezia claveryi]